MSPPVCIVPACGLPIESGYFCPDCAVREAAEAHRKALAKARAVRVDMEGRDVAAVLREAYGDTTERVYEENDRASLRAARREVGR